MCPSTDRDDARQRFAADVLAELLRRIEFENSKNRREPFLVSHAWTEGSMIYLVYTVAPTSIVWGLARDTTESIIDPGPWQPDDDAALNYYLLDLEEARVSASFLHPRDPETILWHGFPIDKVVDRLEGIPAGYRYHPLPASPGNAEQVAPDVEPRRYGNPL
jgi:hypothetical protein